MDVLLASTGLANVASVRSAFVRLGARVSVPQSPADVAAAEALVLPGVGSMGPGMAALEQKGWAEPLRERIRTGRPTLAICLGMQLLLAGSEEAPGGSALGIVEGCAETIPDAPRLPHFGWNQIQVDAGNGLLRAGQMYFAHSYALTLAPAGWRVAWTEHGSPLVAAMERGAVLACQFHPELSGDAGQALLGRWLERAGVFQGEASPC